MENQNLETENTNEVVEEQTQANPNMENEAQAPNLNEDIDMIFKLDKYTVENNYRNYDTNLIEHLKK